MSRSLSLTVEPGLRDRVVERVCGMPGVTSVALRVGASVSPAGDLIGIDATNEATLVILELLAEMGALDNGSLRLGEPTAMIAPAHRDEVTRQGNEASWEEMSERLRRDTNVTSNFLLLMAMAGAISTFGLVSDTLHIVIGGMLIAPGFEPLLRTVFGILGRRHGWRDGVWSSLAGYLVLAAGAGAALPIALLPQDRTAAELPHLNWVMYWSSIQVSGLVVSLAAGVAGAVIVSARLTVFATGVMVALALVPSMALFGVGLAVGNLDLLLGGLQRWAAEVLCVLLGGGVVLALKRRILHHRQVYD
jgi:hypothetical protein